VSDAAKEQFELEKIVSAPANVPTVYVDYIANLSIGTGETVKFHFVRVDPPLSGNQATLAVPLQIVMPTSGFLNAAAFINTRIKLMIRDGYTTKEEFEKIQSDLEQILGQTDGTAAPK
jgi:hypothetical protein